MAKAEKYRVTFQGFNNIECQVQLWYEGYSGSVINLQGAAQPFVIKEYNVDEDLFKPIRPFMAQINIISNSVGVSITDFISDNDTDIDVYFNVTGLGTIFTGTLLQDDFQEEWVNTNHIITLTSADRFGYLKEVPLSNNGAELSGLYTPLQLIEYAMQQTSVSFLFYRIINNLFHTSMNSANTNTPLEQCRIDAKTFQQQAQTYDSSYSVLEKINRAFNQTVFLYNSYPFFLRLEELYTSYNNNLRGVTVFRGTVPATKTTINKRYDVFVGINEEVKPISPEMLRFIKRRTKKDTIQYNYEQFDEIFCNQTFERGAPISSTSTLKLYNVNNWDFREGALGSGTVPTTGVFRRAETYATNGSITDNYVFLSQDATNNRWIRSCGASVLAGETFTFSVDARFKTKFSGAGNRYIASFQLVSGSNYYMMDETGTWFVSNSTWSVNAKVIEIYFDGSDNVNSDEWTTMEVSSKVFPESGTLYVVLWCANIGYSAGQEAWFKNIQITYNTNFNGYIEKNVTGVQSIFTKSADIKNRFEDQIYIDDGVSNVYKGTIFELSTVNPTSLNWYRYRYNTERYGFRKQNSIANWEHNRYNRNKIDANFYGLIWDDNGSPATIGLMNTIRFVDDDVNKVYAILNLKEVDYASNTWSATLIEVFDEVRDVDSTQTFEADFTLGTYAGTPRTASLTLVTAGGFSIVSGNTARYDSATTLNTPIDCSIFGSLSCSSYPTTVKVELQKNNVAIKTINYPVYIANQGFSFNLSVGSQTIATNDTFKVVFTGHSSLVVQGGDMKINSPTNVQSFDTYEDKYLYR